MSQAAEQAGRLEEVRGAVLAMPMAQTLQLSFLDLRPGDVELAMPVLAAWC